MTKQLRLSDTIRRFLRFTVLSLIVMNVGLARAQSEVQPRSAAQLEQLVAPIALYPDALLSQVLMASTYPLEVVAAARWSQANQGVTGTALQDAMQKQPWDPSVKALTAVPQTLQMMNGKLDWTQELGDAFLAQQADVLDAVQRLRQRADNAGNLKTTEQQNVTKAAASSGGTPLPSGAPANVYTIEAANPDEYYVPVYDPGVVYGAWPYPEYTPFYWYPPGYIGSNVFSFAAGVFVGAAIWGGVDWWRHRVDINVNRFNSFNRTNIADGTWTHNPAHRGAVPYRDQNVAQRFGNPAQAAAREGFREKANAGRQEIAGGKLGQKGAAPKAAAAAAGAGAAAKLAGAKKTSGAKQARSTPATQHRQAAKPKQNARASQGAHNRQVAQHRTASRSAAPRRQASAPSRGHVSRGRAGGRGGGRRSDIRLKHDIMLVGHLSNGLGFYRFTYNGGDRAYVGVMAQEVRTVMPEAVVRGSDGYWNVRYERLGLQFQTYQQWVASGAVIPALKPLP